MVVNHRTHDCAGYFVFEAHDSQGVTYVYCSECGVPASQEDALSENKLGEALRQLTTEGQTVIARRERFKNRIEGK